MNLIAGQPVNHVASRFFQPLGPVNVVFFIEPGPQLHHDPHFLAVFRRLNQSVDDLGVFRHPVQSDLNGNHVRILGSLLQQPQERIHRVIGIIEQQIFPLDLGHHRFLLVDLIGELRFLRFKE